MIEDYLKASRGENCFFYKGDLHPLIHQVYDLITKTLELPEEEKNQLIIVCSKIKNCEYVKFRSEVYIIFDKTLLDDLINWKSAFYGAYKGNVDQTETVKYLALRQVAEEYYARGDFKSAYSLGCVCRDLFYDVTLEPLQSEVLRHGVMVISIFILFHEMFHWFTTEYKMVPSSTISLQEDLLDNLKIKQDADSLKKLWGDHYGDIKDDYFSKASVEHYFKNLESSREYIISSAKEEDEDIRCDMLAFLATEEVCSNLGISYQSITNNIFLFFRNLRVVEFLKRAPDFNGEKPDTFMEKTSVPRLQARHFSLRRLWIINAAGKGYSNDEINNLSNSHDDIIDYLVLGFYPNASLRMLSDPIVIAETNEAYEKYSRDEFIIKTNQSLSTFWEGIFD